MESSERILVTEEGWSRLRQELSLLQHEQRMRTCECVEIAESAERGGKESEYLQSPLAYLDRRIEWLEDVLSRAVPVISSAHPPGTIGLGSRVTVRWEDGGEETYTIVGTPEADARGGRISCESPVGRALMGRLESEWTTVESPSGRCRIQVLRVE